MEVETFDLADFKLAIAKSELGKGKKIIATQLDFARL